jgi:tetratricopeptide (TPR) repeat protein
MNWKFFLIILAILPASLSAQTTSLPALHFGFAGPMDAARDQFNSGRDLFADSKYPQAENVFREVVRKYPKNPIADRAHYYWIRSLIKQNKANDARTQIDAFVKLYPKSEWLKDVQEERLSLTNVVPPQLLANLAMTPESPRQGTPAPPAPTPPPGPGARRGQQAPQAVIQGVRVAGRGAAEENPEIRLQREALRVLFEANADRAIEISAERLKADPADAVALGNLYMLAQSRSERALPMLVTLARTSPDVKTRKEAVTWISRSRGEKDTITDILITLIPSMVADDDSSAIAFALNQVNTTKSIEALAAMALDKNKSDRVRSNALSWIAESRVTTRVALLENIYKGTMDSSRIRRQVVSHLAQSKDPQAVRILANVAATDPDQNVKFEAVSQLGQIKTPEALKALEDLLMKKP